MSADLATSPRVPRPPGTSTTPHPSFASAVRVLRAGLLAATTACGGTGGADLPRALREAAQTQDVRPLPDRSSPELRLYVVSGHVHDDGWSRLVAVDSRGRLVEGPRLFARLAEDDVNARTELAISVLLGEHGRSPLRPTDERPRYVPEAEWATVQAPRDEGGILVFFVLEGEMHPEVTEIRVRRDGTDLARRSAQDVLLASGREVPIGPPRCWPVTTCGCYAGCVALVPTRVPNPLRTEFRAEDGRSYGPADPCEGDRCLRVCWADAPTASCEPAPVPASPEPCEETCLPTEAPYHCETLADGCRAIPHTVRQPPP